MGRSMPVPLLDLRAQYAPLREEIRAAFDRVADSQVLLGGPELDAFEAEAAAYCRSAHAVGCSSGTDALVMALMALDVGPGDDVLLPSYTFFATAGSVARLGARPVFVDIDPVSFNVDLPALCAAVTPRAKAIIPVHLYGQCADMPAILSLAEERHLAVVEDAAQAIGAECGGLRAGGMGNVGCFSFYPTKNLGAFGDAGLLTTQDAALAERLRMIRNHGSRRRYYHEILGGNFRLDALQAAILRIKLRRLDAWTEARRRNAARYNRLFSEAGVVCNAAAGIPRDFESSASLILPHESPSTGKSAPRLDGDPFPGHRHVYNQYVVRVGRRDAVIAALQAAQIGHEIYYPVPLHRQECFAALNYPEGSLPAGEAAARTTLALPVYPELTAAQQEEVVAAVLRGLRS